MRGLPIVRNLDDFSAISHVSKYTIYQLSRYAETYYKTFEIPKKSGGSRLIAQPSRSLKGLQAWILRNILDKMKVSDSCKGFEKGSTTGDNAQAHVGANIVVNMDLEDFFQSVTPQRVYAIFRIIGYNSLISSVLTHLCTFKEGLPQGGPCSPKLANLATWNLDVRIQGYVGKKGIVYTRYADDLSFSGGHPNKVCMIIPTIRRIVESEGFRLNDKKTRIAGTSRRKKITGLVLSESSFGIGRQQFKKLRAKIHRLSDRRQVENMDLFNDVKGWLAYLNSVDKYRHEKAIEFINKLLVKDEESVLNGLLPGRSYPMA